MALFNFALRPKEEEKKGGSFSWAQNIPQVQRATRPEDTRSGLEKTTDFLFGGIRKTVEAVESLTGKTQREQEEIDRLQREGKISNEEAQRRRQRFLQDTEFAGMKDEGRGRKALGVAIEGALDVPFVGTLAKTGVKAVKNVADEGVDLARIALRGGKEGAVIGSIAGGGISAQGDDRTAKDIATGAAIGTAFGGVVGATLPIALDAAGNVIRKLKSGELQIGGSTKKIDPLDSLRQEAKKYKSAEEFVDSQQVLYHGTNADLTDISQLKSGRQRGDYTPGSRSIFASENPELSKRFGKNVLEGRNTGKTLDTKKLGDPHDPNKMVVPKEFSDYKTNSILTPTDRRVLEESYFKGGTPSNIVIDHKPNIHEYFKSKGYSAIQIPRASDVTGSATEMVVIDPSKVMSTKRLTDLYNEATGGKAKPELHPDEFNTLHDFIDYANGNYKPGQDTAAFKADVQSIFKRHNIPYSKDPQKTADFLAENLDSMKPGSQLGQLNVAVTDTTAKTTKDIEGELISDIVAAPSSKPAIDEAASSIADRWSEYNSAVLHGLDEDVSKKFLSQVDKTGGKTLRVSSPVAEAFKDIRSTFHVMSEELGQFGSDVTHRIVRSAHLESKVREHLAGSQAKINKLSKKLSKSDTGRVQILERIVQAAEDRPNAQAILGNNKKVQELYQEVVGVLDYFKTQRVARGFAAQDNYFPRDYLTGDAGDNLIEVMMNTSLKSKLNVESTFSKARKAAEAGPRNVDVADVMNRYIRSQTKEWAYQDTMAFIEKNIDNIPKVLKEDGSRVRSGLDYLGVLVKDALDPGKTTKLDRLAAKGVRATYLNQLFASPRFYLVNRTQKQLVKARVTNQARFLRTRLDGETLNDIRKGVSFGTSPISGEIAETAGSPPLGRLERILKGESKRSGEEGNVFYAYDNGFIDGVIKSDAYKSLIKQGAPKTDAFKLALQDPATRELATRAGNVMVNSTQFGGNQLAKAGAFRSNEAILGVIPRSVIKQYKQFASGMTENIVEAMRPKYARELDILMRGNPAETIIVDYSKVAKAYLNSIGDVKKGIKDKTINNMTMSEANLVEAHVKNAIKGLDKEIKNLSNIRGPKSIARIGRMWAYVAAIQFMFQGASDVALAIKYGAPISTPGRGEDPTSVLTQLPAVPFENGQFSPRKAANLIPGVGLIWNRARDLNRLIGGE